MGRKQSFHLQGGDDILYISITVLGLALNGRHFKTGCQNGRFCLNGEINGFLKIIDCAGGTNLFAFSAEHAEFRIKCGNLWYGVGKRYSHRLCCAEATLLLIRNIDRAGIFALTAAYALVIIHKAWFLCHIGTYNSVTTV